MKKLYISILFTCIGISVIGQDQPAPSYGIKFKGFVKTDVFYDSRQTVNLREGHFLLWPEAQKQDVNNNDINAKPSFNMLSIQSRLTGGITGPDAFGAKTSGMLEADFFGNTGDENGFRLRHAIVKLNWEKTELMVGQFWNPMFVTSCFPDVVSFNTGAPFQPFSRNPQIRVTHSLGKLKIIAAALSQRDFGSRGAAGASSTYLRNSSIPDAHLQLHYTSENPEAGTVFQTGIGVEYKTIVPRLSSLDTAKKDVVVDESLSTYAALAFASLKIPAITVKLQGVYGQNLNDILFIGNYGVTSANAVTGEANYAATNVLSSWLDVHTNGKKIQFGLFGGYSENMGADKDYLKSATGSYTMYGLGTNIQSLYRISPRVVFNSEKTRFALETEYTSAMFGKSYDAKGKPINVKEVSNLRVLLGVYYFF